LHGNPKDVDTWQKILSIRNLLVSKNENLDTWFKFSKLALKQNQMQVCKRVLDELKTELKQHLHVEDEYDYPSKLVLQNLECEYMIDAIKQHDVCEKISNYLQDRGRDVDNRTKGKMYLKMGNWIRQKTEELT